MSRRTLMLASDLGRAVVQALTAILLLTGEARALAADRPLRRLRRARGVLPPRRGRPHPGARPAGRAPAGQRARRPGAERRPRARPGGGGRAARALLARRGARRRRRHLRGQRGVPRRARASRRVTPHPAEHVPNFWRELGDGIREVRQRRWMLAFMPAFSAYHLVALPCVLALGAVLANEELGGAGSWAIITVVLRRRHDRRLDRRPALEAGPPDAGGEPRVRRRLRPAGDHRAGRLDRRDRRLRGARGRSPWRSASPSGRRRSAG